MTIGLPVVPDDSAPPRYPSQEFSESIFNGSKRQVIGSRMAEEEHRNERTSGLENALNESNAGMQRH
jgi:hypothetical protein